MIGEILFFLLGNNWLANCHKKSLNSWTIACKFMYCSSPTCRFYMMELWCSLECNTLTTYLGVAWGCSWLLLSYEFHGCIWEQLKSCALCIPSHRCWSTRTCRFIYNWGHWPSSPPLLLHCSLSCPLLRVWLHCQHIAWCPLAYMLHGGISLATLPSMINQRRDIVLLWFALEKLREWKLDWSCWCSFYI